MNPKCEIGGFFELELLKRRVEYHKNAVALNSGRSCLAYILEVRKPDKIFVPFYSCDSILEPIKKANINYVFYKIGKNFEPVCNQILLENEYIIIINYFGVIDDFLQKIARQFPKAIIDNTQSFFSIPMNGVDSYYSPRKFFGVADGGYLYTDQILGREIPTEVSYNRCIHLLKRHDSSAGDSYSDFLKNENSFSENEIKSMSRLTRTILSTINYPYVKLTRKRNFILLHKYLYQYNRLHFDIEKLNGPMIYPFLHHAKGLKEFLIHNRIYIPTYWDEVLKRVKPDSYEAELVNHLIPLPIDQRYGLNEMLFIVNTVLSYISTYG